MRTHARASVRPLLCVWGGEETGRFYEQEHSDYRGEFEQRWHSRVETVSIRSLVDAWTLRVVRIEYGIGGD